MIMTERPLPQEGLLSWIKGNILGRPLDIPKALETAGVQIPDDINYTTAGELIRGLPDNQVKRIAKSLRIRYDHIIYKEDGISGYKVIIPRGLGGLFQLLPDKIQDNRAPSSAAALRETITDLYQRDSTLQIPIKPNDLPEFIVKTPIGLFKVTARDWEQAQASVRGFYEQRQQVTDTPVHQPNQELVIPNLQTLAVKRNDTKPTRIDRLLGRRTFEYKYTDSTGNVHYKDIKASDLKQAKRKAQQEIS